MWPVPGTSINTSKTYKYRHMHGHKSRNRSGCISSSKCDPKTSFLTLWAKLVKSLVYFLSPHKTNHQETCFAVISHIISLIILTSHLLLFAISPLALPINQGPSAILLMFSLFMLVLLFIYVGVSMYQCVHVSLCPCPPLHQLSVANITLESIACQESSGPTRTNDNRECSVRCCVLCS